MQKKYTQDFYLEMNDSNLTSAREIIPVILKYVSIKSIVDVGCGVGLWLRAFKEYGVSHIKGIDGNWVSDEMLVIPKHNFEVKDFEVPFQLSDKADVVLSLEVAEHISEKNADQFIKQLTSVAPVVVFSAAIPLQGGSRHVNEQWPDYWEHIFAKYGYVPVDCVRKHIWGNKQVAFFYAQNIFFFVKKDELKHYPKLESEYNNGHNKALSMVHPHMYLYYAKRWRKLVPFLGKIPVPLLHTVKKLLHFFSPKD